MDCQQQLQAIVMELFERRYRQETGLFFFLDGQARVDITGHVLGAVEHLETAPTTTLQPAFQAVSRSSALIASADKPSKTRSAFVFNAGTPLTVEAVRVAMLWFATSLAKMLQSPSRGFGPPVGTALWPDEASAPFRQMRNGVFMGTELHGKPQSCTGEYEGTLHTADMMEGLVANVVQDNKSGRLIGSDAELVYPGPGQSPTVYVRKIASYRVVIEVLQREADWIEHPARQVCINGDTGACVLNTSVLSLDGSQGVRLFAGGTSSIYLPSVAQEIRDIVTYMGQLSTKGGSDENAWKREGARILVFTSIRFEATVNLNAHNQDSVTYGTVRGGTLNGSNNFQFTHTTEETRWL
eukprot:gnl/TRDRNA2_/TRDRNA2_163867_c1_seq1.p1 gnl/TRDRNA2_/TRDRNA2_163867_c1~~gnl/TRDRNA2_/TRDRNA2_163867_c1_seq1.p1  ORF type:complete len:354 (-),score=28.59 gnl/TRDRNA2_/TRDRNA2_163867_c1_seq1:324-1385(-)